MDKLITLQKILNIDKINIVCNIGHRAVNHLGFVVAALGQCGTAEERHCQKLARYWKVPLTTLYGKQRQRCNLSLINKSVDFRSNLAD